MENIKENLTPAEKHYLAMKRAQSNYQKRNPEKTAKWQKEYKERLKQDPEKWAIFVEKNRAKSKAYYAKCKALAYSDESTDSDS
jgi:hypothetical protein